MNPRSALAARIAQAQDEARDALRVRARVDPFTRRVPRGPEARRPWVPLLGALAIAAAALLVWWEPEPELSFTVRGRAGHVGDFVERDGAVPLALRFEEGTQVTLATGAALRVLATDPHGATLALERGRIDLEVEPRPDAAWQIHAGPYVVSVLGTGFSVDWRSERLEVHVAHGRVAVRGPDGRTVELGADEHLEASPGEWRLANEVPPEPVVTPALPLPEPEIVEITRPHERARPARPLPAPPPSWLELADRGDYRGALDAAEEQGIDALLEHGSSDDLSTLVTVARLAGAPARAVQACEALRRRFPHTRESAIAAFQLGRLSFERDHDPAATVRFMDLYLAEAPSGDLARDARGRRLEALRTLHRDDDAASAAREYLSLYPDGPHAAMARQALSD